MKKLAAVVLAGMVLVSIGCTKTVVVPAPAPTEASPIPVDPNLYTPPPATETQAPVEPKAKPEPAFTDEDLMAMTVEAAYSPAELRKFCLYTPILGVPASRKAFAEGFGAPMDGITGEELFDYMWANAC
jgi:hypothetical protein